MTTPAPHSPTPWTVDPDEGVIRAVDGAEVAVSPTPHVMEIDKTNLAYIVQAVNAAAEEEKRKALEND